MANKRGMPSMLALLGLLALAGYQNRERIGDVLKKASAGAGSPDKPPGEEKTGIERLIWDLGDAIGRKDGEGGLAGGLGELVDRFKKTGQGEIADSWMKTGPNRGLTPQQVEEAVGANNLQELSRRTGLSYEELLERLATSIPEGVDELTPEGHLPTEDEVARLMGAPPPPP